MSQTEVKQVTKEGDVSSARRFDARDFSTIEEYVLDEFASRLQRRIATEKQWKEIDRQVAMEPETAYKRMPDGQIDANRNWMAEIELPLQAQALEVLTADARRFMKPDTGLFFKPHAETTDEYLHKVQFQSIILGDETEVPSHINQDNADKLVGGFITNFLSQYDFWNRIDKINAESFKYGMGVGRGRMETKNVYIDEARGVRKETQEVPVLVPCTIKNLFLDDSETSMHSSQVLGPAHIWRDYMKFSALAMAANKGSDNPDDPDGGWMPKNLKKVEPDGNGYVTLLEMEGDIILPRKTVRSMVIPNVIVTVAVGGKNKAGAATTRALVRLRFRKYSTSSYLLFPYHYEGTESSYPTSPLMKGRPIQAMCSAAANRLLDSAMLNLAPPVGFDRTDPYFAANGGPKISPFAQWATSDPISIKVHSEIGGDPAAMAAILTQGIQMYSELTGVLPARLGAQTVSHTTAFAKDAEIQRGATRTVDYVNQVGNGAMLKWLDMSYCMARDAIKDKVSFFIHDYGGWVKVTKDQLPENVVFDWLGAGGPQDKNQELQNKTNALLLAQKIDQINLSTGKPGRIDYNNAVDAILREGGWTDIDSITNHATAAQPPGAALGPGTAVAAIQNLTQQLPQ